MLEKKNYHKGSIYTLDWSITGKLIATGSNDNLIKIISFPQNNSSFVIFN